MTWHFHIRSILSKPKKETEYLAKYICFSVAKSCPTVCDPMDCSKPGFPVLHYLPVCSNSCPLSQWSHPIISSSVIPFSCLQSFLASGSFPMSQLFTLGSQGIGVSASASVLPVNFQSWFPLGLTGLISLLSKGLSRIFFSTNSKASVIQHSAFFMVQLSHLYMTTGKTIDLTIQTFVGKVMSLLLNTLSRFVIMFLPRSKRFMAAVIICSDFGAPEYKICHFFHCFPIYLLWSDGTRCHDLSFLNVEF